METGPSYYQPPSGHDAHLRAMFRWLTAFFVGLFLLALTVFLFADRLVAWLPFAVEKRFVRPYEAMAERWLGEAVGDPEVEAYLQELTLALAEEMSLPEGMTVSVHYLESGEINAFASLGGHIFVLRGLFEIMPDENSLSMVLAHELSHLKHRDPVASLGRGVVLQLALSYFTGNSPQAEELSQFGGQLGLLRYSRQQEARADQDALEALQAHYGHVGGYRSFFDRVLAREGDATETPDWLQTHPDLGARIDAMEAWIEERGYAVGATVALPEELRAASGRDRSE